MMQVRCNLLQNTGLQPTKFKVSLRSCYVCQHIICSCELRPDFLSKMAGPLLQKYALAPCRFYGYGPLMFVVGGIPCWLPGVPIAPSFIPNGYEG